MEDNLNLDIPELDSNDTIIELKNSRRELSKKLEKDENFKKEYLEKIAEAQKYAKLIQESSDDNTEDIEEKVLGLLKKIIIIKKVETININIG
jgi:hypothetical protein